MILQSNYSDIDVKQNPWFNGQQLGVVKARKESEKLEPHYKRLSDYVGDLWMAITDHAPPDFSKDKKGLNEAAGLWSKARAGELGMAISGISNEGVKKRVIQNLYEAAGSISYVTGLNKEEMEQEKAMGMEPSSRKTNFNASVYVKVF